MYGRNGFYFLVSLLSDLRSAHFLLWKRKTWHLSFPVILERCIYVGRFSVVSIYYEDVLCWVVSKKETHITQQHLDF